MCFFFWLCRMEDTLFVKERVSYYLTNALNAFETLWLSRKRAMPVTLLWASSDGMEVL